MSGANLDRAAERVIGDRYRLNMAIGSGASAEVYQATDLRLGRSVAVKQLRSNLTSDARFAKLFRSEAHLAAQLSHPNILTVLDWNADADGVDGGAYIVSEMLGGGTLRTVLDAEGTISLSQAGFIGLQAARGLTAAHDAGLVHRDIKPANLLFGADGRVHIGDFGIARAVAQAAWTEPEGVLIGTARYAAPEQARTGSISGLVDVYSLAVCLIEALTGEVPLVQETAIGTMVIRQSEDLPVDDSFGVLAEPLAWAGLADPTYRATAAEFSEALLAVCRTLPDPDPLILVDLTDHTGSQSTTANVHIDDDGVMIIGGDHSDLELPAAATNRVEDPDDELEYPDELTTGRPRRRRLRLVLGFVLFLAVLAGAGIGGRMLAEARSIETETLAVGLPSFPVADFEGLSASEVEAAVADNAWTVVVTEEFVDGTEAGMLLAQSPEPGVLMAPGGTVELVYSLGPVRRNVPEMVGQEVETVRMRIEAANLAVGVITEQPDESVEAGVVLEATIDGVPPQPGTEFLTGTPIDLLVSSGPAPRAVPSLVGLTVDAARVAVQAESLQLVTTESHSQAVGQGLIIESDPAAGAVVGRDSTVTVTVSLGRPFVVVPDVSGQLVSEAIELLRGEGFEVEINGTIGSEVIATRPVAGSSVRSGSSVEIISAE